MRFFQEEDSTDATTGQVAGDARAHDAAADDDNVAAWDHDEPVPHARVDDRNPGEACRFSC
jgi:hypothetical protein